MLGRLSAGRGGQTVMHLKSSHGPGVGLSLTR